MSYRQAMDRGWFKEHTQALTKGRFWLSEESDCLLGEPIQLHPTLTGYVSNPIGKRRIRSYANATPGAEEVLGVSLDIRYISSGVSNDDIMMRPDWYYPREITTMQLGICPIINEATGYTAQINDTALPANGGAVSAGTPGASTGYTLGKWLQETPAGDPGLVFVDPMRGTGIFNH